MRCVETLHEEEKLGKVYDSQLMRRLLRYVKPHARMASMAVVLIILSSFLQLIGPLVVASAVDLYIAPVQEESQMSGAVRAVRAALPPDLGPAQGIVWLGGLYLVATVLSFGILYLQAYIMLLMGQKVMFDLRQEVFAHVQKLPVSYFDRNPVGRIVTRVTTDVAALNELFTAGLVSIFGDIVLLVGIVGLLFWLDWRLALVAFTVLPLLLLLTLWFKIRARQRYRAVRVKIAAINSFLQEHITGMSVVQLFNRENRAFDEYDGINAGHRDANIETIFYYAIYYPSIELITAIGIGLVIWYGGGAVISGVLSVGALIAFVQLSQRFYQPLADLSEKYNTLQSAMASSERIFALLDKVPEITSPPDAQRPDPVRGDLSFDEVSFRYNDDEPVLEDVSFDVKAGETLAVVGHTGAGKSTLANLMLRFYDARQGAVRVDGVDVRDWDLAHLRRSIGLVLQDVFLFSGTLGYNIGLGAPSVDEERLRWAAGEVGALPFIDKLPKGFDARVKERGAGLSVGQKQLIAFARALAFDPRILILDEATSSIDTETEHLIQAALDRLLDGRTSVVIAHRLSTIQKADRILVMHKGRVREMGTHEELLELGGIYAKLYQLQYQDQEAAGG